MFDSIKSWISEHPYLTGVLVLVSAIAAYLIFSSGSSSSATSTQSATGPSDALQAANLQAQVQQQAVQAGADVAANQTAAQLAAAQLSAGVTNNQTAAAQAVALQQILSGTSAAEYTAGANLAGIQDTNAAAVANNSTNAAATVQVAGINATAGTQIAGIGASRDIAVATIQGQVNQSQIAAQLAGLQDTNKTSVALGTLAAGVTNNQTAAQLAALENTNATAATVNSQNNTTQALAISTQGNTDLASIAAQQDVNNNLINTTGTIAVDQIQLQQNQLAAGTQLIQNGTFNKGGEGGINQVTAFLGSVGSPAAGTSAAAAGGVGVAQNSGGNTPGGILSSLGGLVKIGVTGLFGGAPAAAAGALTPAVTSTFTPGAPVAAASGIV